MIVKKNTYIVSLELNNLFNIKEAQKNIKLSLR